VRSILTLTLGFAAACGHPPPGAAPAAEGGVPLRDTTGREVGTVALRQRGDRVEASVRVSGLPPGTHGIHLHEIGRCQPPAFQSAGPDLNPGGTRRHGHRHPQGHHTGDLGNITLGADGKGEHTFSITNPQAQGGLAMFLGGLGRSLVIHANPDDELSQPDGKSGPRIACAELR
jgi:Cu-Zn family superoxide dismutase